MIFLEGTGGGLGGLIEIILIILFGPAILLAIIGFIFLIKKKKKIALVCFILAVLYVIISLGICKSL